MNNDKIKDYDITKEKVISNCCEAIVYECDICGKCFEHCEPINVNTYGLQDQNQSDITKR